MEEGLGREAKSPRKLTFWDVEAVMVREVVGEMKTVANLEDISEKKEPEIDQLKVRTRGAFGKRSRRSKYKPVKARH